MKYDKFWSSLLLSAIFGLIVVFSSSCIQNKASDTDKVTKKFTVSNKLNFDLENQLVDINLSSLGITGSSDSFSYTVLCSGDTINATEIADTNGDAVPDRLLLLCNLKAREKKQFSVVKTERTVKRKAKKCTQAELAVKTKGEWVQKKAVTGNFQYVYEGGEFNNLDCLNVPEEHTDHSYYIKYEGPGWESEKIGYRFYLDWRNAVDVFGKTKNDIVLHNIGTDGFESYHFMEDWGMDILKVGPSLGIGSIGYWNKNKALRVEETDSIACNIVLNGNFKSIIETNYYGWKIDSSSINICSKLSINADSRITKQDIFLSTALTNICTGIVKDDNGFVIQPEYHSDNGWSYFATYGPQSLNNDNLGLFILYNTKDIIEITEDANSYALVLKPSNKKLTYYFGAAWSMEENGIKSKEQFLHYLQKRVKILNNPVRVFINQEEKNNKRTKYFSSLKINMFNSKSLNYET